MAKRSSWASGSGNVPKYSIHEERLRQVVADTLDRHLVFAHRLQQRGLRAGRRPVDLVAEQDIGENGARIELELADDWEKASMKRALDVRLSRVQERVEAHIKSSPISDEIYFASCEEQSLAEEIFQKKGYKTSFVSEEGMDGVKYWPADEDEPFEGI